MFGRGCFPVSKLSLRAIKFRVEFYRSGVRPEIAWTNVKLHFTFVRVIESFRHKGLRLLFENDDARKVSADMVERLRLILSALDTAETVEDMNQPTFRLHPLKGQLKGFWAITVRANWRVIFRFADGNASDVDLTDYH